MVNFEAVKKLLESQGKLDFKPFHIEDAKQEYWAYRTTDSIFHICNNDLSEIDKYDFKSKSTIKSWDFCEYNQKVLFVLERENDYLLLEEGVSVTKIQEEEPKNLVRNVWLINDFDGKMVLMDIREYRYIGRNSIIFDSDIIEISNNGHNYWVPEIKITCFDSRNLKESEMFYCGTYNNESDLFFRKGHYFMEHRKKWYGRESRWHFFENIVIWFYSNGILLVDISPKGENYLLELYENAVEMHESYGWDYLGDKCIGSHIVNKELDFNNITFFASDNVFMLSNYSSCISSWVTIDKYGILGCSIREKKGKVVSLFNDIIKTESSSRGYGEKKYDFYDYTGICLAREVRENAHFAIVSKTFEMAIYVDEYKNKKRLCLKGVLDTQSHLLIIPVKYVYIELFDKFDSFYAIIGEEYTNRLGNRTIQYGLFYNNNAILPCNKENVKSLSENMFVWMEGNKYGLISNGEKCSECIYDKIFEENSIGLRRIRDKHLHDTYRYQKNSYAVLQIDDKSGVFVPEWNLMTPTIYSEIRAFVEERTILADGKLFKIKDGTLTLNKEMLSFDYIGGLRGYHLFRYKCSDKYDIDNYICYYLSNDDLLEEDIDVVDKNDVDEEERKYIRWENYGPVFSLGDGSVFYSVKENVFYDDINRLASYPEPDIDEGYNYERDTYYALGGDDYDKWKENGGDLDGMMEGMGF